MNKDIIDNTSAYVADSKTYLETCIIDKKIQLPTKKQASLWSHNSKLIFIKSYSNINCPQDHKHAIYVWNYFYKIFYKLHVLDGGDDRSDMRNYFF